MKVGYVLLNCLIMAVSLFKVWFMKRLDWGQKMEMSAKTWILFGIGGLLLTDLWVKIARNESVLIQVAWLVICVYFLSSALVDSMSHYVYDWFQIWGMAAAVYLALQQSGSSFECIRMGGSLIIFAILQAGIFMRLYGEADGMTFLVAALAESFLGYGIRMYLLHMIVSYLLLAFVQICKRNVGSRGSLKIPVPFVPYIMFGFYIVVMCGLR